MSYDIFETSVDSGQPVEIYIFEQGLETWRYTSGPDVVTVTSIDYEPASIVRSEITQNNDISKSNLTITFPRDNLFAKQFLGFAPDLVTKVTVRRSHSTDSANEWVDYWKGRVIQGKAANHELHLMCESVFTSMRRVGLRSAFQKTCRHTLYSVSCGVNMDTYKVTGVVQSATATSCVVNEVGALANGWFTGGIVKLPSGAMRFIVSHTASQLTFSRPFVEDVSGLTVEVFPGCDHLKSTCNSKYANGDNFGGFPYIPPINPFSGISIV